MHLTDLRTPAGVSPNISSQYFSSDLSLFGVPSPSPAAPEVLSVACCTPFS
uniref:Uncharacterized protein n=1 Tax=Rhizophora mucronata TaxID=61149 RepID=A0A2P2L7J8_RHIMU